MRRSVLAGMIAAMLFIPGIPVHGASGFADSLFLKQWYEGEAVAPNFWGPVQNARDGQQEPYKEAGGGKRLVQYFDKGRMELTNGSVTNGLLASEIVTGQVQIGDATFQPKAAPTIPIAGDPDNTFPTYAQLGSSAASLLAPATAQPGGATLSAIVPNGTVVALAVTTSGRAVIGGYDNTTKHNVPGVFVDYRTTAGLATIGLAISEPFAADVKVAGQVKQVMVQVFERRVLTYTAANPAAFQVEMGNIGQHYYQWRYGGTNASGACTEGCVFLGNEGGPGLADATICLSIAGGSANPIGKTDATGHYAAKTPDLQGHQETIIYWPVKAGYAFTPKYSAYSSYGGNDVLTRNFVATTASAAATDCGPQPFR